MAVSAPGTVTPIGNPCADAIRGDDKWDQSITPISYGFTQVEGASNPWTSADMIPVFAAITAFAEVANLKFEYTLDGLAANIEFYPVNTLLSPGAPGASNGPEGRVVSGQVADANTFFDQPGHAGWLGNSSVGGASNYTVIHGIGHALLGLEHPHGRKKAGRAAIR